jgi:hypothetical protein
MLLMMFYDVSANYFFPCAITSLSGVVCGSCTCVLCGLSHFLFIIISFPFAMHFHSLPALYEENIINILKNGTHQGERSKKVDIV